MLAGCLCCLHQILTLQFKLCRRNRGSSDLAMFRSPYKLLLSNYGELVLTEACFLFFTDNNSTGVIIWSCSPPSVSVWSVLKDTDSHVILTAFIALFRRSYLGWEDAGCVFLFSCSRWTAEGEETYSKVKNCPSQKGEIVRVRVHIFVGTNNPLKAFLILKMWF